MGVITDYFIADPDRAQACVEDGPARHRLPTLELKGVEPAVLGSRLWAIIENLPDRPDGALPFDLDRFDATGPLVAIEGDGELFVLQIADGFVEALAGLADERVTPVSERWARAEEWGAVNAEVLASIVLGLRDFARQVRIPAQHMYVHIVV